MSRCWTVNPADRPTFVQLKYKIEELSLLRELDNINFPPIVSSGDV